MPRQIIVFITVCYVTLSAYTVNGQRGKTITVKAGSSILETLTSEDIYRYPAFTPGNVYLLSGAVSAGNLNYNRLLANVQFINATNDTLSLANERTVYMVTIDKDTFYYNNGFLETYPGKGAYRVAKMERIIIGDAQKIGAYGMASPNSAINSYSQFSANGHVFKLNVMEDVILKWVTTYLVTGSDNQFVTLNKKNLLKIAAVTSQPQIKEYLDRNNTNFNNEEQVSQLAAFLRKL